MKIAFDAKRLFNNHTGLGNYSRTLVDNLFQYYPENEYALLATKTRNSEYLNKYINRNIIEPKVFSSSLWRSFGISKNINSFNPDIYHGLSNEIPFSSSKVKARKLVTIHDLFFLKYPRDFSAIDRKIYAAKTKFACKHSDHIIAISESTKEDIVRLLGIPPKKISVVYQSCHSDFQKQEENDSQQNIQELPKDFFLYVGTINQRKNLAGIIDAMSLIPAENRLPLVVVGNGRKDYMRFIYKKIEERKLKDYIVFLGRLENKKLRVLYKNARFFCLPSFYEGFGIPIIESLYSGTPVITSAVSAMPEAVGNCGLLIDPNSPENLSSALQKFGNSEELLEEKKKNIKIHLKYFSSKYTSSQLMSVYTLVC